MKKRIALCIIFPLLLAVPVAAYAAAPAEFPASAKTGRYHYPDCKRVRHIKPGYLVKFKTPADAVKAGYNPCKVCKPPVK